MRGLGKAAQAIGKILVVLGIPKWVIGLVVGLLLWWLVPRLAASIDKDRARRVVRTTRLHEAADRKSADAEALQIAGEDIHTLVVVAEEAIRDSRRKLAEETIAKLTELGAPQRTILRLEADLYGPLPATSIEAVIRIEKLQAGGLHVKADALLERCLRRWPEDPELRALTDSATTPEAQA